MKTSRDALVVDIDRDRLIERMEAYFDSSVSHEEMRRICPKAMKSTKGFDSEQNVPGVTSDGIEAHFRPIGNVQHARGVIDPTRGDLAVTAGWGYPGRGSATMPGKGNAVERDFASKEMDAFISAPPEAWQGADPEDAFHAWLGERTYDIYLNDEVYWQNVPARIWEYRLGGYRVLKKWLSYREKKVLGRDIEPEKARYITEVTRRIAAILLLEPRLDTNYEAVKANAFKWPEN